MKVLHLPVTDGYPPTSEAMATFLKEAKAAIDAGGKVYVHCWLGKGRTGTFLAAYLIHWEKMDPKEAIEYIRQKSPGAISTAEQVKYLTDPGFPTNALEESQPPPVAKTLQSDACYQSNNQTTDRAVARLVSRTSWMIGGGGGGRNAIGGGGVCFIGSCD